MNRISQFWYAITNALHNFRRPTKCMAFLQTVELISQYCLSGQHSYTRGTLADTNTFSPEIPDFKYKAESHSHRISLWHCLVTILITSLQLPSYTSNLLQPTESTVI